MFKSFIETQFPVSKVSKESYKERKANHGQTLTGLGKWWGRKPLILVRAALVGLLIQASADPVRDREIFLKILTMDEDGLWLRKSKNIPVKEIYPLLTPSEREQWLDPDFPPDKPKMKRGTSREEKEILQHLVFHRLSYDEKLDFCDRPEQVEGPSQKTWAEINAHLGTTAKSLPVLVQQLGERQFGRVPRVGDAFCGGGSVPFEAARLGCDVYGSDLNPVAALLTWSALNIVGGGKDVVEKVRLAKWEVYQEVDRLITEWGIEHNELGWRADAYLYCNEVICPECGWQVPLAPSWVIGEKTRCVAMLKPDEANRRFEILIESDVSQQNMIAAKKAGTVRNSSLVCAHCDRTTPMTMLRGDRRGGEGNRYGLRLWESHDIVPRSSDVFQERLYCIRWVETYIDEDGNEKTRRYYMAPDDLDLQREERVLSLLNERFNEWQEKGYIPSRRIESGYNTDQPIRERGWTHWHHLFNPRQILVHGLCASIGHSALYDIEKVRLIGHILWIGSMSNRDSKTVGWVPSFGVETTDQVFNNQALNTKYNWGCRGLSGFLSVFNLSASKVYNRKSLIRPVDSRQVNYINDCWITDPPYADAINYHEVSDFFLAWYEKFISKLFPSWYIDSKRALAITGSDENFRRSMVDCYRNLVKHMPDNGTQIVMFTHQDAGVWADLALILWAAGLRVTAAWCIATETDSSLRQGNYVQGTVLLVLRKQYSEETAFFDEIYHQVEEEVKSQLNDMLALDDQEDPNFGDTDYQLAAYAAALRVLTRYRNIEEIDVTRELSRTRQQGEQSPVVEVINHAVKIACDHLIPQSLDTFTWKSLAPEERFYLKGLDMESRGEYRAGAYQELARGFGLREYRPLMAETRANQTRVKNAGEFGARQMGDTGFGATLVRQVLFAVRESVRTGETVIGRNWFRNELQGTYWDQRQTIIKILYYLASLGANKNMPHWHEDANAARLLAGAVENDHV